MSRDKREVMEAPGQDSFLDVIANLVGIILILIMTVGTQAKDAFVKALERETPAGAAKQPSRIERDALAAETASAAVEKDFQSLAAKMKHEELEIQFRQQERAKLIGMVNIGEKVLKEKRGALTAAEQQQYDQHAGLNRAKRDLNDLKMATAATLNSPPTPGVIEHLPTPLAKTVFGKELHLRLMNGKITFVPLNEMVEKLKDHAQQNISKLRESPRVTESFGPMDGFRLKYTLVRVEKTVQSPGGPPAKASMGALERFVLIPVSDDLGEPLELALQDNSGLRSLLKEYPPDRTTITVWVYPESFEEFRKLKAVLFNLGYATAGRPLPDGHPIGGSPDGSHSAAQ